MKEWIKRHKLLGLVCLLILSALFCFYLLSFTFDFSGGKMPVFGVTFSIKYAQELNLDWQQAYTDILTDLKPGAVRLVAYWDDIEVRPGDYNFVQLDWQINEAEARGTGIMVVVGRRTPRWPECHDPAWLAFLSAEEVKVRQLNFVRAVIERYKDTAMISAWQVENEPLLAVFGRCPKPDKELLEAEIGIVKSLDQRPVVVTDSGELSLWQKAAAFPDVFGTTMYRIVWNKNLGFWDYFFVPPAYYRYKADLTKFFHKNLKEIIVTEMQMEPWTYNKPMVKMTLAEQQKSFNLKRFKDNIAYVKKTGFPEVYLWGVEYWYWLKQQGQPQIWEEARKIWQQ